mmetsp:Transcript_26541/g.39417  ORF Transcript_26541/g.39417 Transcript_26541/m.39417 type:complete len:294 (-) Transcript_26541:2818-3699(-)
MTSSKGLPNTTSPATESMTMPADNIPDFSACNGSSCSVFEKPVIITAPPQDLVSFNFKPRGPASKVIFTTRNFLLLAGRLDAAGGITAVPTGGGVDAFLSFAIILRWIPSLSHPFMDSRTVIYSGRSPLSSSSTPSSSTPLKVFPLTADMVAPAINGRMPLASKSFSAWLPSTAPVIIAFEPITTVFDATSSSLVLAVGTCLPVLNISSWIPSGPGSANFSTYSRGVISVGPPVGFGGPSNAATSSALASVKYTRSTFSILCIMGQYETAVLLIVLSSTDDCWPNISFKLAHT